MATRCNGVPDPATFQKKHILIFTAKTNDTVPDFFLNIGSVYLEVAPFLSRTISISIVVEDVENPVTVMWYTPGMVTVKIPVSYTPTRMLSIVRKT